MGNSTKLSNRSKGGNMADSGDITTRDRLILAGMDEIRANGIQGFSLRRVAAACGVSCAAPYKHFEDKQQLFDEMILYANEKWLITLSKVDDKQLSTVSRIANASVCFIKFLISNPHFRSILMIKEMGLDTNDTSLQVLPSIPLKRIFVQYAYENNIVKAELLRRMFITRSLLYGAALIVGTDNSNEVDSYLEILRETIIRGLQQTTQ